MLAIFLDQEATGLDPNKHAVIEIAFKVIDLNKGELVIDYQSIIQHPEPVWQARHLQSMKINGITREQIQAGKSIQQIREEIIQIFSNLHIDRSNSVFICQNPAFDRAYFAQIVDIYTQDKLKWPYHWLDLASIYFSKRIKEFPETLNLSKDEIANHYQLPPENKPHRAMNGVDHLILCYDAVVGIHQAVK